MKQRTITATACILFAVLFLYGCAARQLTDRQKLEQHIRSIKENNATACVEGCLVFEGDSNVELINFQEYFSEPACNLAYRGSRTCDLLTRKEKVGALRPSSIIVLAGGNDLLTKVPISEIDRNYGKLIRYYRSVCKKVYCISNLPVHPGIFIKNSVLEELNERLARTCASLGAAYVPVFSHLKINGGLNPDYAMDPVHLNRAGQDVLAGVLKKYLKK